MLKSEGEFADTNVLTYPPMSMGGQATVSRTLISMSNRFDFNEYNVGIKKPKSSKSCRVLFKSLGYLDRQTGLSIELLCNTKIFTQFNDI